MGKKTVKEVRGLIKEEGDRVKVYIGGKWISGGKDEQGVFYLTRCTKCGSPVRQYLGKRGPKALYCNACKTSGTVKVQDGKIVTKRGVLELIEE